MSQCTNDMADNFKNAVINGDQKDPTYPNGCKLTGYDYDYTCCNSLRKVYDPNLTCPYDMLDPVGSDANKHHLHCNIDSKLRGNVRGNVRGNEKSSSGSGLSTGAIVGISVGGFILIVILVWLLFLRKNKSSDGSSSFSSSN